MLAPVAQYYAEKIREHGPNHRGVDWSSKESQDLRFKQLCALFRGKSFTVCDVGCGYGELYWYMLSVGLRPAYTGIDICPEMLSAVSQKHPGSFVATDAPPSTYDYCVASGIFNVKLDASYFSWWAHVKRSMAVMDVHSTRGFAFNCLTKYSDMEKMRDSLFYADPCKVFDLCKRKYKNVALLHDYDLYEFTILVRK